MQNSSFGSWRTVRCFISSTFRDMHAERDYLVKSVFPGLREKLEKHRIHFVDVDLRWGVTQEQANNDLAVDVCLRQVHECRPFFLGILGERYGYVPAQLNVDERSDYGWVLHEVGRSLTELEILYGVLRTPRLHRHAFFFFRDCAFSKFVPSVKRAEVKPEDEDSARKMALLKATIRAAKLPVPPVENYPCRYRGLKINWRLVRSELDEQERRRLEESARDGIVDLTEFEDLEPLLRDFVAKHSVVYLDGLEEFGRRVDAQLWQAIQTEFQLSRQRPVAGAANADPFAEEADAHERFMESRLRIHVERERIQGELMQYIESERCEPCLLVAPSGAGKSAVLSRFVQLYREHHPQTMVISHFVGASSQSTNLRRMLMRFCQALRTECATMFEEERADRLARLSGSDQSVEKERRNILAEYEVPRETAVLVARFRQWLEKVSGTQPVLIVIDALDQFDEADDAHALNWLPWQLPRRVKLVSSCILEEPSGHKTIAIQATERAVPALLAVQERPHLRLDLEPLSDDQRRTIIARVPSLSAKVLDEQQIQLLLNNPATTNPLFLLVALEELRGFGSYAQLNTRIAGFPRAGDAVTEIFKQVIERFEEEFDPQLVHTVLTSLACARSGLSERELQELAGGTGDVFTLLRQLRPYIHYRGDLVDFYHRGLFKAVLAFYAAEQTDWQGCHRRLAAYFRKKADPDGSQAWDGEYPRGLSELPYHQAKGDSPGEVKETITSFNFMRSKVESFGPRRLLEDYELLNPSRSIFADDTVKSLQLIERALRLSLAQLQKDRTQLASQLYGRLCAHALPEIQMLSRQIVNDQTRPWLRLLGSSLTPPGGALLLTLVGHRERVAGVAVSSKRGLIVSGSGDATVKVWDLENGTLLYDLEGHTEQVSGVTVSADGRLALSSSDDGSVKVWDLERGLLLRSLEDPAYKGEIQPRNPDPLLEISLPTWVESVAVTADGRLAVSGGGDAAVKVWEVESGLLRQVLTGHTAKIWGVAVTPDGGIAVSASADQTVKVWDLERGQLLHDLKGHTSEVGEVDISVDGRLAITGSQDMTVKVWDLETGQLIHDLAGHQAWVGAVAMSADLKRAYSGAADGTLKIWDLEQGQLVDTLVCHTDSVMAIALIGDGRRVVTGCDDATVKVWDVAGNQHIGMRGHTGEVTVIAVGANGRRALSGSGTGASTVMWREPDGEFKLDFRRKAIYDPTIIVWDLNNGARLHTLQGHQNSIKALAVSSDSRRAVSGSADNTAKVWDLERGELIRTLEGHEESIETVAISADAQRAVSCSDGGVAMVWDLPTGQQQQKLNSSLKNARAAVTPDLKWLVHSGLVKADSGEEKDVHLDAIESFESFEKPNSEEEKHEVKLWNLESGQLRHTFALYTNALALSADGRWAVFDHGGPELGLWDLEEGRLVHELKYDSMSVVAMWSGGQRALSGSIDGSLKLWDLRGGKLIRGLEGHTDKITAIALGADGRRAVSSSEDHTVRVWDVETGSEIASFHGESAIVACAATPDLALIAAGDEAGRVHLLRLEEPC